MGSVQPLTPDEDLDRSVHQTDERQRLEPFGSPEELEDFFRRCDATPGPDREPDWEDHLDVIARSRGRGAASYETAAPQDPHEQA